MIAGPVPISVAQPGLCWELNERVEAEPTWTHDPNEDVIIQLARFHLGFKDQDRCTADYFMQGAFNKIYLIRCPRDSSEQQSYIFRVSLPVDPDFKVSSDVATMKFIAAHTDIPVPRVIAFDSSHHNQLGFAWTIMNLIPGRPLAEQWRFMNWKQRVKLVERIADANVDIFKHRFNQIGNLYKSTEAPRTESYHHPTKFDDPEKTLRSEFPDSPDSAQSLDGSDGETSLGDSPIDDFRLGRIVSMPFIWHKRVQYRIFRGPYFTSYEWLRARLDLTAMDCDAILHGENSTINHKESAHKTKDLVARLKTLLPQFYAEGDGMMHSKLDQTILHHYDTSGFNVMIDQDGSLSGVLDWDGVSAVPLWRACQLPEFLTSTFIDEFGDEEPPCETKMRAIATEKAKLVNIFLERVERQDKLWVKVYHGGRRIKDFDLAVQLCDSRFRSDVVAEWVASVEQGMKGVSYWSLAEKLAQS